ncbi:MAG: hypothetical protein J1E96_07480 [Ruminococcus sp.]|nr:hypothetical protein [Ruminococcus sp.]
MPIDFRSSILRSEIKNDEIGIEKESLRITGDGRLAHTAHPFDENEKNIDRDFCENQIEFISDIFTDSEKLVKHLEKLHDKAYAKIKENGELLWPFSNPPHVSGEDDIHIAKFSEEHKQREDYRNYLANKYGKMKMLFSGIHYNFSFSDDFIREAAQQNGADYSYFKNGLYLELAKKLTEYGWLIVYLTAASPLLDSSYIKHTALRDSDSYRYASVRCGEAGYWNDFIPVLNYNSLKEYTDSIRHYVDYGLLKSSSELYYPTRLKPCGENTLENLENGVNHIELRTLDLNPFSRVGILREDIDFIHLFILWLLSIENTEFCAKKQTVAIKNIRTAALFDDRSQLLNIDDDALPIIEAARRVLNSVSEFTFRFFPEFADAVAFQAAKLHISENRYADAVRGKFGENYTELGLKLAKKYAKEADKNV